MHRETDTSKRVKEYQLPKEKLTLVTGNISGLSFLYQDINSKK
jgi:hypothetical protein